jgi:secondary thiamine-phosphate synthase enzyme
MKTFLRTISLETKTQIEFVDITERVEEILGESGIRDGIVVVYSPHTTMGVTINHNEPLLVQDFMMMLYRLAPVDTHYNHDLFELKRETRSDGRSNGHSHCKTMLVGSSETIPVERGRLLVGKLQSIFAVEFDGSRKREISVRIMGE